MPKARTTDPSLRDIVPPWNYNSRRHSIPYWHSVKYGTLRPCCQYGNGQWFLTFATCSHGESGGHFRPFHQYRLARLRNNGTAVPLDWYQSTTPDGQSRCATVVMNRRNTSYVWHPAILDTFCRNFVRLKIGFCRRSSVEERGSHNP